MSAKCRCDGNAPGARALIALQICICATPVFLVTHESLAADNNRGAQLAATCVACHRLDGRDKGIPSIIGLDEGKLAGALQASNLADPYIIHTLALSLITHDISPRA